MPILLCNEFSQINPELTNIQQESFQLSLQGRSIISQIMRDGHTQALLDHLTSIIARLNELAARSVVIANVEQFTDDRLLTVNWTLFDTLPLNEAHQLIEIEYFDYNGMFWTPKNVCWIIRLISSYSQPEHRNRITAAKWHSS